MDVEELYHSDGLVRGSESHSRTMSVEGAPSSPYSSAPAASLKTTQSTSVPTKRSREDADGVAEPPQVSASQPPPHALI
ncbi:hypothetical protein GY45DRAFT_1133448 [Cubamyces sp. BRFM 1775]|nr:hypothetical protein GY45DRAFT_1133448 [Cubamyces sp. BRFM 1775]